MTDTTPASCRTHLTDAEVAALTRRAETAERQLNENRRLRLATGEALGMTGGDRWNSIPARAAETRDAVRNLSDQLARALELIAELRDAGERFDRAFARYDTGGGETPPDPGSVPRAQGVAADRPEIAVDGQTPVTGSRGMGRDANGAQNAAQAAGVWDQLDAAMQPVLTQALDAMAAEREAVVPEPAESDTAEYHWGRAWAPTGDEAICPCPKAPCGYVIRTRQPSGCEIHGPTQTMRGGHPADRCPGKREG